MKPRVVEVEALMPPSVERWRVYWWIILRGLALFAEYARVMWMCGAKGGVVPYTVYRTTLRLKLGLFGAELLKWTKCKSAKSATGDRPARGRPAGPPQKGPRSSGRAKPLKRVPGGPPQKGPRSAGGPKAAKVGGYRPLRKKVMAPPAGQSC